MSSYVDIERRIAAMEARQRQHLELSKKVELLAQTTADNTREVVLWMNAFKGAFVVLDFIGKAAKPVAWFLAVAAAIGVLWQQWVHGNRP